MADWLFFRRPVGWTWGLFGFALLAVLLLRYPYVLRRPAAGVLVALQALLLASNLEQPGTLATCMALLGFVMLALTARIGWTPRVGGWVARIIAFGAKAVFQPWRDEWQQRRWLWRHARRRGVVRAVLLWVIPVVLSLVFIGLFIAANPIISKWAGEVWSHAWHVLQNLVEYLPLTRTLLWIGVLWGVWALWRVRLGHFARAVEPQTLPGEPQPGLVMSLTDAVLSPGVVTRCLALFNTVFAVQTILDARYLWAGAKLPEGFTYAQYAHRGAYPLLATALLAGVFVLVTFRRGGPAESRPWARALVGLWVLQNVILMANAMLRLAMYVEVYSLTRWRVAAAVWMLLVAVGFVWIVLRIALKRSNAWLVRGNVLTALAAILFCALANVDGFIAQYNVRHCREVTGDGVTIDLDYLRHLGPESLPALEWLRRQRLDRSLVVRLDQTRALLRLDLRDQLSDWRGWTWRRQRLLEAGDPTS